MSACSSNMKVEDYSKNTPVLDLFDYFDGKTRAWGMFQDRKGNLKRQFVVDLVGKRNGDNELVLMEDFVWSDGEISQRKWTIKKDKNGHYTGKAADVVGVAKGRSAGNAFYWTYIVRLPVGDKTYDVKFDDWMFLQADGVLINRAKLSKFGFNIGEVIISFNKPK